MGKRVRRDWSEIEDDMLVRGVLAGQTCKQIGALLNRSVDGVSSRRQRFVNLGVLPKVEVQCRRIGLYQQEYSTPAIRMVISEWLMAADGVLMRTVRAA